MELKTKMTKQEIIAKYKTREAFRKSEQYRLQRDNLLADNFLKALTVEMRLDPLNTQFVLYWIRNHSKAELVQQLREAEREDKLKKIFSYDEATYQSSIRGLVLQMYNISDIREQYLSRARTETGKQRIQGERFENREIRKQIKEFKYQPEYIKKKRAFRSYISQHLDLGKSTYEYVSLSDFDTPEIKKVREETQKQTIERIKTAKKILIF